MYQTSSSAMHSNHPPQHHTADRDYETSSIAFTETRSDSPQPFKNSGHIGEMNINDESGSGYNWRDSYCSTVLSQLSNSNID